MKKPNTKKGKKKESISNDQYLKILQELPDIFYKIDPRGRFTLINKSIQSLGYKPKELIGKHFSVIMHPDDVRAFSRRFVLPKYKDKVTGDEDAPKLFDERRTGKRKTKNLIIRLIPKRKMKIETTKKLRFAEVIAFGDVSSAGYYDNHDGNKDLKFLGTFGIIRDITERKIAEDALSMEKEKFATYINLIGVIVVAINSRGKITYINKKGCEILGYEQEQITGKDWFNNFLPRRMRKEIREYAKQILSTKDKTVEYYENLISTKSGEERLIAWHNIVLRDASGKIVGTISSGEDITERKQEEKEKEKIQNQLFHIQKMEVVGSLAGGIAHDFNNLLTAITGYAELMQNQIGKENPLYKDLGQIRKIVKRAATLVRQLLIFSRKEVLKPEVININDIVSNMEKMLNRLIGENIILETALEKNIKTVKADIGQIEQVIVNLVVNARDAMPKGGKLIVKTRIATIDESSTSVIVESYPGIFVCLSVQDTGTGMDQETIRHIFEPFYTTKKTQEGTGLGLSVVYGIVKQHQGWINIYSKPGEGAIFKVYLPTIAAKTEEVSKNISRSKIIKGKGERILLVEDDENILQFAKRALVDNGYEIFPAQNAQEAEEIFKGERGRFNIVFSDVMLPDKSGFYLAEKFLSLRPELKVILTSGYVGNESQRAIIREKGYHYIEKPYALSDLLQVLSDVIQSS